jgi:hypothetical protein
MSQAPKYKVTGIHPVMGNLPGEEFRADLDPVQEQALVGGGAIVRVSEPKPCDDDCPGCTQCGAVLDDSPTTGKLKPELGSARAAAGKDAGSWRPR